MTELSDLSGKTANQIDDWFGTRGVGKHIVALQHQLADAVAEAHDAGAERAIWKEIAERPDALGAVAMRERAAELMLDWAQEAAASIDTGHPSGMNVAREVERDTCKEAAETIRALPLPTHADLLAAALELPEIKALVNAGQGVVRRWDSQDWKSGHTLDFITRMRAALTAALAQMEGK